MCSQADQWNADDAQNAMPNGCSVAVYAYYVPARVRYVGYARCTRTRATFPGCSPMAGRVAMRAGYVHATRSPRHARFSAHSRPAASILRVPIPCFLSDTPLPPIFTPHAPRLRSFSSHAFPFGPVFLNGPRFPPDPLNFILFPFKAKIHASLPSTLCPLSSVFGDASHLREF